MSKKIIEESFKRFFNASCFGAILLAGLDWALNYITDSFGTKEEVNNFEKAAAVVAAYIAFICFLHRKYLGAYWRMIKEYIEG